MTTIKPGTKRWAELVRDGQAKDASLNWFLGDAALEIAPMGATNGGDRTKSSSDSGPNCSDLLVQYADEVGVSYDVLAKCRQVANAWPAAKRTIKTSWKAYSILMAADKQHLLVDGMTVTQASLAAGHKNPGRIQSERDAQIEEAKHEAAETARAEAQAIAAEQRAADLAAAEARLVRQQEQDAIKAEKMATERAAVAERNAEARERAAALETAKRQETKARIEKDEAVRRAEAAGHAKAVASQAAERKKNEATARAQSEARLAEQRKQIAAARQRLEAMEAAERKKSQAAFAELIMTVKRDLREIADAVSEGILWVLDGDLAELDECMETIHSTQGPSVSDMSDDEIWAQLSK